MRKKVSVLEANKKTSYDKLKGQVPKKNVSDLKVNTKVSDLEEKKKVTELEQKAKKKQVGAKKTAVEDKKKKPTCSLYDKWSKRQSINNSIECANDPISVGV